MNFLNIYIAVSLCHLSIVVSNTFTASRNKRTIGALFRTFVDAFQRDRQPEPEFKSYRPEPHVYTEPTEETNDSVKNTQVKNEDSYLPKDPDTSNIIESGRSIPNYKLEPSLMNTNDKTNTSPTYLNVELTSSIENDITTQDIKNNSSILNAQIFVRPLLKNENKHAASDFLQHKNYPLGYHAQIFVQLPKSQFLPYLRTKPIQNSVDSRLPYVEENSFKGLQNYDSTVQVEPTPIQEYIDDIPKVNEIKISSEDIENENLKKVGPIQFPKVERKQKTETPLFVPYFASEGAVKTVNVESKYKVNKENTQIIPDTVDTLQSNSHSSEKDKAKPLVKGSPVQSTKIEQELKPEYPLFLPFFPSQETVMPVNFEPEFKVSTKVPEVPEQSANSGMKLPTPKTEYSYTSKEQHFNYYGSQSGQYYPTDIASHNQQETLQNYILPNGINNNLGYKYQPRYHTKPQHTPVHYTIGEYQQPYSIHDKPQNLQYQQQNTSQERPKYLQYLQQYNSQERPQYLQYQQQYNSQERPQYLQYQQQYNSQERPHYTANHPGVYQTPYHYHYHYLYPPQYYGYKRFSSQHYCNL